MLNQNQRVRFDLRFTLSVSSSFLMSSGFTRSAAASAWLVVRGCSERAFSGRVFILVTGEDYHIVLERQESAKFALAERIA